MSPDTSLPPSLFDLDEPTSEPVYYTAENPFRWACTRCGNKVAGLDYVGGGNRHGTWLLCGNCAARDLDEHGKPKWGITERSIAIGKIRGSVYATGGGETEVTAAVQAAGYTTPGAVA